MFISLWVFTNAIAFGQDPTIQWRRIDVPTHENCYLISAESIDDFWISDDSGNLYHYIKNNWTTSPPPDISDINYYRYIVVGLNRFICSAIDQGYKTHFFYYDGRKWLKYALVADVPVRGLCKVSPTNFWAYGDWGRLFRLVDNHWERINTPIEHHILDFTYISETDIWLSTRAEGIYHYNGVNFENVPIKDYPQFDIQGLTFFDPDEGLAFTSEGTIYCYDGIQFEPYDKNFSGKGLIRFFFINKNHGIAYGIKGAFHLYRDGRWDKISIPTNYRIHDAKLFSDGTGIVTSEKGIVIIGSMRTGNYFKDLAGRYYVDGSLNDKSTGAAFIDVNSDNLLDLFVLNTGPDQYNRLFLNMADGPFSDITNESGLLFSYNSDIFAFGDINKDGNVDAIFSAEDAAKTILKIFTNSGKAKFGAPTILTKEILINERPVEVEFVDYDRDGDFDLYLTYYYGHAKKAADNILLINRWWGNLTVADSSIKLNSTGWNRSSLFADFNNDNILDVYISNWWWKDKLLINQDGEYVNETESRIPEIKKSNSIGAAAVDYDNDGDLDLLVISNEHFLKLYQNDSNGYFTDVNPFMGFGVLPPSFTGFKSINFGDFNNDGFIDLFISARSSKHQQNWLYLNDSAKTFIDMTKDFGLENPIVDGTIVGDIDNDGDLDIFGFRDGSNVLWINNLNNQNYLKIALRGVISNTSGMGSKIWLYDAGHLNEANYLRGYRQIGTDNYRRNIHNSAVAHFGVDHRKTYDIKVQFYGGKSKILRNVSSGQMLIINETDGIFAFAYYLPGKLLFILRQKSIHTYALIFALSIAILLLGVKLGTKYFDWDIKLIVTLIITNTSIFWILLILIKDASSILKYLLPLFTMFTGTLLPLVISYRINSQRKSLLTLEYVQDELLKLLLVFSHGEWALRNLNSIQLFSENALGQNSLSKRFKEQFNERKNTFFEMTLSNIDKIISLSKQANVDVEIITNLEKNKDYVSVSLDKIASNNYANNDFRIKHHRTIAASVEQIKKDLTEIKNTIYGIYSTDAINVIANTTNALEELFRENKIEIRRVKIDIENAQVLITNHELADILDNCLRNSVRALSNKSKRLIEISVYRSAPKIHIDIKDNGCGIAQERWEKVFESGYSEHGGTGTGLFQAWEILKKYGGRLYIKESQLGIGTTFTIDLNAGEKK